VQVVTFTKTHGAQLRCEPSTIDKADINISVTLLDRRCLNNKLMSLFELGCARRYGGISFEIKRSMGGSVVSSFLQIAALSIFSNDF